MYSTAGTPESRRKPKTTVCNVCGKDFESEETLNTHKKIEHSESTHSPPAGVA
ncbi:MAG TPA: C2H2-type zinc finger protein [Nitrososphaeraceae archaeon]|nr:C2H2-type zinc finger protein [Nitrososphaeraceae archaeon]